MEWLILSAQWAQQFFEWLWLWNWVGKLIIILTGLLMFSIFLKSRKAFLILLIVFLLIVLGSPIIDSWFSFSIPGL